MTEFGMSRPSWTLLSGLLGFNNNQTTKFVRFSGLMDPESLWLIGKHLFLACWFLVLKEGNTQRTSQCCDKVLFTLRPLGILSFCEIPSYALVHMFCQFENKRWVKQVVFGFNIKIDRYIYIFNGQWGFLFVIKTTTGTVFTYEV